MAAAAAAAAARLARRFQVSPAAEAEAARMVRVFHASAPAAAVAARLTRPPKGLLSVSGNLVSWGQAISRSTTTQAEVLPATKVRDLLEELAALVNGSLDEAAISRANAIVIELQGAVKNGAMAAKASADSLEIRFSNIERSVLKYEAQRPLRETLRELQTRANFHFSATKLFLGALVSALMAVPPTIYTVKVDGDMADKDLNTKTDKIEYRLSVVEQKLKVDGDIVDGDLKTKTNNIENRLSVVEEMLKLDVGKVDADLKAKTQGSENHFSCAEEKLKAESAAVTDEGAVGGWFTSFSKLIKFW